MKVRWILLAIACAATVPGAEASAQEPMVMRVGHSGWLGFSYSSDWRNEGGDIVVDTVIPESPAAAAGLRKGDTVLEVNGLRATSMLLGSLALEPGDVVELTISREGDERSLRLVADERPEQFAFVGSNVFTLRTDSAFTMLRGMLDSARIRLDSMDFPKFHFRHLDGDSGRAIIIRGTGESVDTIHMGFDTDSLISQFHFFGDSVRSALDSVFVRMAGPRMQIHIRGDSVVVMDSTDIGIVRPFLYRDGERDFEVDLQPMRGFVRVGFSAVAGMELQELSPALGEYFGTQRGLLVLQVGDDTPADRAGIEEGDVILRVGDRDVESISGLRRAIAAAADERVDVVLLRQRREVEVELPVGH